MSMIVIAVKVHPERLWTELSCKLNLFYINLQRNLSLTFQNCCHPCVYDCNNTGIITITVRNGGSSCSEGHNKGQHSRTYSLKGRLTQCKGFAHAHLSLRWPNAIHSVELSDHCLGYQSLACYHLHWLWVGRDMAGGGGELEWKRGVAQRHIQNAGSSSITEIRLVGKACCDKWRPRCIH